MTIRKGSPWGEPRDAKAEVSIVSDDAALAEAAYRIYLATLGGDTDPASNLFRPSSGDVLKTLGLGSVRAVSEQMVFPFDLGLVRLDGDEPLAFSAHVICRNRHWSGAFATIMNVGWCGNNYFGPRAHPNDGLLDITEGSLPLQQRLLARSRLKNGSHLPHPNLKATRRPSHRVDFVNPTAVFVDGVAVGRHSVVDVELMPDVFKVVA